MVLCGSGRWDGSEIQESVLSLLHLERRGVTWEAFAPDSPQWAVCSHLDGSPQADAPERNQLAEAARIARGNVRPLAEASAENFDLLVMPGGNGAAHNLCDFAEQGAAGAVEPDLDRLLREFHAAKKPIAAICIAPAIVAMSLGGHGPKLTLGEIGEASAAASPTGAEFQACAVDEICVDADQRIVSTPAYMLGPDIAAVDRGIEACIEAAVGMVEA